MRLDQTPDHAACWLEGSRLTLPVGPHALRSVRIRTKPPVESLVGREPRGGRDHVHSTATPGSPATPIERCLVTWHSVITGDHGACGRRPIADDAVLHSPIVYTPQRGKDLVVLYLTGAIMTFGGLATETTPDTPPEAPSHIGPDGQAWDGRFRYVRTVLGTHDAILEFETTMKGKYVNGVDMIRCDDEGRIVDFKVMIRPLQAVNTVHESMATALEQLRGGA